MRLEKVNSQSSKKAKLTFLIALVCSNDRSTEIKSSTHCHYLQNDHDLTLVWPIFWPVI